MATAKPKRPKGYAAEERAIRDALGKTTTDYDAMMKGYHETKKVQSQRKSKKR